MSYKYVCPECGYELTISTDLKVSGNFKCRKCKAPMKEVTKSGE